MNTYKITIALALILTTVFSCSSPSDSIPTVMIEENDLVEVTRSHQKLAEEGAEETNFIFAKKWTTADNHYVDLKIDGTFEAQLEDEQVIVGKWSISSDETTLYLNENQSHEGKGSAFNAAYIIDEISDASLKVTDIQGKAISFISM